MLEIKTVTETFNSVRCAQNADPYFWHLWTAILLQNSDIISQEFIVIKIYRDADKSLVWDDNFYVKIKHVSCLSSL